MHSDGEDYYEIYSFLYHPPSEHPLEHSSGNLVSGLAVVKGACVAAAGRGWVRAGRSHSSLKARRHHRCKGITVFFVVTSPNL